MNQFCGRTRREFVWQIGAGFGGAALTALLDQDGFFTRQAHAASQADYPLASKPSHFAARAKHCIFLFMYGGPSQMDLFDYKPELQRRDGQTVDIEMRRRSVQKQKLLASRRRFQQHGEAGLWCSDALPHLAQHMDELCVLK